jgi:hypothetical protein
VIPGLEPVGPSGVMVPDPYGWSGSARVALSPGEVVLTCPADDPLTLDPDLVAWAWTPDQARQVAQALHEQDDWSRTDAQPGGGTTTVAITRDPARRGIRITLTAGGQQATIDLPDGDQALLAAALEDAATLADLPHPDLCHTARHVPRHIRDALITAVEDGLSPIYVAQVFGGLLDKVRAQMTT